MADLDYFPTPGNLETTGVGGSIGGQTFHWQSTVISQYANSAVMMTLCDTLFQSLDQINNLNRFYDDVWNIRSARGYGLDVWGRIVVASRTLPGLGDFFGFDQGNWQPFGIAPFYRGVLSTDNFVLTDDAYRVVILAKALANVNGGAIPDLNRVLQLLFPGRGNCYVTDGLDMTMSYVFEFALTPVEIAIITTADVLQSPTGVTRNFVLP